MDKLSSEEMGFYQQIMRLGGKTKSRQAAIDRKALADGNDFVESMSGPFGQVVMSWLEVNERAAMNKLIKYVDGNIPVPESVRIEYKHIRSLSRTIQNLVVDRETRMAKVRRVIADFTGLDKADNT
jgi:hypothetical protein